MDVEVVQGQNESGFPSAPEVMCVREAGTHSARSAPSQKKVRFKEEEGLMTHKVAM